jgi:hypothetical protein
MASSKLARFLNLPGQRKKAFLVALLTTWAFRIELWVLPYPQIRKRVSAIKVNPKSGPLSVEDIIWSIETAGRFVINSTCLIRALAAKKMLSNNGIESDLWIGIDKSSSFAAHAWIEHGGRVVLGGPIDKYKQLYVFD